MIHKPKIIVNIKHKTEEEIKQIYDTLNSLGWCFIMIGGPPGLKTGYHFEWKKDSPPIYPENLEHIISKY